MKSIFAVEPERITFLTYTTSTGCAPSYSMPSNVFKRAEEVAKIFNDDGTFNASYEKAEEYALCLCREGNRTAAKELFKLIVGDSTDVLLVRDTETDRFPMVANTIGKLGCEGLSAYAVLLHDSDELELAGKYFREMVDKEIEGAGIRGGDLLVEAAHRVLMLDAYLPESKEVYEKKYMAAKQKQY